MKAAVTDRKDLAVYINAATRARAPGVVFSGTVKDELKETCQKSGIVYGRYEKNGFIFLDLRLTFTTNARRAGVHENVAMAIMGHSPGRNMNAGYDNIERSDLISAVDKIEIYLHGNHHSNHHAQQKKIVRCQDYL